MQIYAMAVPPRAIAPFNVMALRPSFALPRNALSQVLFLASTLHAIRLLFVQWRLLFMRIRNLILALSMALAVCFGLKANSAEAETVVRYGISMADIPLTTGQPDRGAGAYQFTAYTIYDPLVAWEMDVSDRSGKLVPGLATEWKVDDKDKTKWRFTLRKASSSMTAATSTPMR